MLKNQPNLTRTIAISVTQKQHVVSFDFAAKHTERASGAPSHRRSQAPHHPLQVCWPQGAFCALSQLRAQQSAQLQHLHTEEQRPSRMSAAPCKVFLERNDFLWLFLFFPFGTFISNVLMSLLMLWKPETSSER